VLLPEPRADDADHLAGGDLEVDVAQHLRPVDAVAEGDVLEGDVALIAGSAVRPGL
jgi:hypothetical protein